MFRNGGRVVSNLHFKLIRSVFFSSRSTKYNRLFLFSAVNENNFSIFKVESPDVVSGIVEIECTYLYCNKENTVFILFYIFLAILKANVNKIVGYLVRNIFIFFLQKYNAFLTNSSSRVPKDKCALLVYIFIIKVIY